MTEIQPLLRVRGLSKHYGGITAVAGIDIDLAPGEHAAVVGDNGAGKSTFVRMISGAERPDQGTLRFDGTERDFRSPLDARQAGIETVYQDLCLADDLDVVDNVFLGRELFTLRAAGLSLLNRRVMRRRTAELLDEVGVRIPRLTERIRTMSGGQRQGIAIARAAGWGSQLIILDEPTAALGVRETRQVEEIVRGLKRSGIAVILVSHNLRQVFDLVDTIFVFRRGRLAGRRTAAATTPEEIIGLITGAGEAGAVDYA